MPEDRIPSRLSRAPELGMPNAQRKRGTPANQYPPPTRPDPAARVFETADVGAAPAPAGMSPFTPPWRWPSRSGSSGPLAIPQREHSAG